MKDNQELYRIYLKAIEFDAQKDLKLLNGSYEIQSLPKDIQLGQFAGGKCIKPKNGLCEIMISPNGYVYISKPYHRVHSGTYGFKDGKVVYTIQKGKTAIVEVKVKVQEVKQ
jgi:hypothetical protein